MIAQPDLCEWRRVRRKGLYRANVSLAMVVILPEANALHEVKSAGFS